MQSSKEQIQQLIRGIAASIQVANIYTFDHPETISSIRKLLEDFNKVFLTTSEIKFGIVGKEIFFEKEVFLELSSLLGDFIKTLNDSNIDYMKFKKGLSEKELHSFLKQITKQAGQATEVLEKGRFRHIEVGKFGEEAASAVFSESIQGIDKQELLRFEHLLEGDVNKAKLFIRDLIRGQELGLPSLLDLSSHIFKSLTTRKHLLFTLMGIKRHHDYTFMHCVNVAALTMFQARILGMSEEITLRLGLAGFFHDLGKIAIKESIIDKKGKLDSEEFTQIKNHIVYGAKLLLKNKDMDKLALIVAFEHHLGFDLHGYPGTRILKQQNLASRIVCISDVYDALRSRRSYKTNMPLKNIYELMNKEKGRLLDPDLVDLFFKKLGVWPVGTFVKLNDNQIALVVKNNEEDAFRPTINILYDANKNKLTEDNTLDLHNQENKVQEIVAQLDFSTEDPEIVKDLLGSVQV